MDITGTRIFRNDQIRSEMKKNGIAIRSVSQPSQLEKEEEEEKKRKSQIPGLS